VPRSNVRPAAPYDPSHPDALAVYCSDGRFTNAIEDLLRSLGHPRLDTMTLPGGPALFEVTTSDFSGVHTVQNAATFLVKGHAIKHVVCVAHEGCGYYRARNPHEAPERIALRQTSDLRSAAKWLHGRLPGLTVRLFYARVLEGTVAFEEVDPKGK
jgi:hypothetical protein